VDGLTERALHCGAIESIDIQLTSRCDLRCTYCTQGTDQVEHHTDMPAERIREIIDFIRRERVPRASFGFFGETIIFKGWNEIARELLDAGVLLAINTNFQRILSDNEVDVLSRFNRVAISIDTADMELQKIIRPPLDVRNVVFNTQRLRAHCLRHDRRPEIVWTGVWTDQVTFKMKDLVYLASACGVRLMNFNLYIGFDGLRAAPRGILEMKGEEFLRHMNEYNEAIALAGKLGISFNRPMEPLLKCLHEQAKIEVTSGHRTQSPLTLARTRNIQGVSEQYVEQVPQGYTRRCLAPWTSAYVCANGNVHPCCFSGTVLGCLTGGETMASILNGPGYRELRRGLVTGEGLDQCCKNCPMGPFITQPQVMLQTAAAISRGPANEIKT
jgi:hypothetical protein